MKSCRAYIFGIKPLLFWVQHCSFLRFGDLCIFFLPRTHRFTTQSGNKTLNKYKSIFSLHPSYFQPWNCFYCQKKIAKKEISNGFFLDWNGKIWNQFRCLNFYNLKKFKLRIHSLEIRSLHILCLINTNEPINRNDEFHAKWARQLEPLLIWGFANDFCQFILDTPVFVALFILFMSFRHCLESIQLKFMFN